MKIGRVMISRKVLKALVIVVSLLTAIWILAVPYALGQTPEVLWIRQFGTTSSDFAEGAAADATGNVYVASFEFTAAGSYVRKYNANGTSIWTRQISGARAHAVGVDGSGNVYVFGWLSGTLPGQTSAGGADGYVRKYDPNGNELWTRQFGTSGSETAIGGGVAANGDAYIVGTTTGAFPGHTPAGGFDAFVCKFDADGNRTCRQYGSPVNDSAYDAAPDGMGNVYVAGETRGILGPGGSGFFSDAYIRKYDANLDHAWTRQFGANVEWGFGVATDGNGNAYLVGRTSGAIPGQVSAGDDDAYVRKYDPAGNELWTRQFGTEFADDAAEAGTDSAGNVYVSGFVGGTLTGQTSSGSSDAYVRKYDSNGNVVWTKQFGSSGSDNGLGVAATGTNLAYVVGWTDGTFPGQTSAGGVDAFVAKVGILTPAQMTQNLINAVNALPVSPGTKNSLKAPLNNTIQFLTDGNPNSDAAACGQLTAFINSVADKFSQALLTADEADQLTNAANAIKAALGCP